MSGETFQRLSGRLQDLQTHDQAACTPKQGSSEAQSSQPKAPRTSLVQPAATIVDMTNLPSEHNSPHNSLDLTGAVGNALGKTLALKATDSNDNIHEDRGQSSHWLLSAKSFTRRAAPASTGMRCSTGLFRAVCFPIVGETLENEQWLMQTKSKSLSK